MCIKTTQHLVWAKASKNANSNGNMITTMHVSKLLLQGKMNEYYMSLPIRIVAYLYWLLVFSLYNVTIPANYINNEKKLVTSAVTDVITAASFCTFRKSLSRHFP